MEPYVTVDEILEVATQIARDVIPADDSTPVATRFTPNTNTIPRSDVENAALEATVQVRGMFKPHYDPATIDALAPDVPQLIKAATATIATKLLYSRWTSLDSVEAKGVEDNLKSAIKALRRAIVGRTLEDVDGVKIMPVTGPSKSTDHDGLYSAFALAPASTTEVIRFAR